MSALTDVFSAIANAIRSKNGSSNTYTPAQMATAIANIPSAEELFLIVGGTKTAIRVVKDNRTDFVWTPENALTYYGASYMGCVYDSKNDVYLLTYDNNDSSASLFKLKPDNSYESITNGSASALGKIRKFFTPSTLPYDVVAICTSYSGEILARSILTNTWDTKNTSISYNWKDIAHNGKSAQDGGLYVLVGEYGAIITSPDMNTWTWRTSNVGNRTLYGIAWSPELSLFVAIGQYGVCTTSPDGITWTSRNTGISGNKQIYDITWCSELGLFIAVGNPSILITSPDGVNWTTRTLPSANLNITSVASNKGIIMAGCQSTIVLISTDGTNFNMTQLVLNSSQNFQAITPKTA